MSGPVPAERAVREHLEGCPACRELLAEGAGLARALAAATNDTPAETDALLARVQAELARETGLRALLRSQSTLRRVALSCVAIALSAALTLVFARRATLPTATPAYFAATLTALGVGASLCLREGLGSLLRARSTARTLAVSSIALGLPVALAGVAGWAQVGGGSAQGAGGAVGCFLFGAATSAPLVAFLWMCDRGQRASWRAYLPLAGASGLAANLVLGLHCASEEPLHLLLGHATLGVAWLAAWWTSSRFAGHSSQRPPA